MPNLNKYDLEEPLDGVVRYLTKGAREFSPNELFNFAQFFHQFGLNDQATKLYQKLISERKLPQSKVHECAINTAILHLQNSEFDQAIQVLNDPSLEFSEVDIIPIHFKAFAYYFKNEITRARSLFEQVVATDNIPQSLLDEANFYLGIIKRDVNHLKKIDELSDYYNRSLKERMRIEDKESLEILSVISAEEEVKYYQLLDNLGRREIDISSYKRNQNQIDQLADRSWKNLAYATINAAVFSRLVKNLSGIKYGQRNPSKYKFER